MEIKASVYDIKKTIPTDFPDWHYRREYIGIDDFGNSYVFYFHPVSWLLNLSDFKSLAKTALDLNNHFIPKPLDGDWKLYYRLEDKYGVTITCVTKWFCIDKKVYD